MKTKIEATIPTTQYGNLRPTFELEEEGDEVKAIDSLKQMWNRFGETTLKDKQGGGVLVESFTGEKVYWDETNHVYTDLDGNVLLSGSAYAEQNSPQFDMQNVLPKVAEAWKVDQETLRELWSMVSGVSLHWGSSIHNVLDIAHKYWDVGEKIKEAKGLEKNYVLPKQPYLFRAVTDFVDKYGLDAMSEVLVSDVANGMAGTIDRLHEVKGGFRVGDYKTNAEIDSKKIKKYQKQLSFYAHILQNKGFKVSGLDLYVYDEETGWTKQELDILPLDI